MSDKPKHTARVGKNLLDILMFSMYPDAKTIYREYIQNACDSINEAVKDGTLPKKKSGHIFVKINPRTQTIQIKDNGTGIPADNVEHKLKDIADSDKDGDTSAGLYGIGRLVGAGYCQKLSFKTSYKGENVATEIVFDVNKARAIIDDETDRSTATEVIDKITTTTTTQEAEDEHYFIATLEDVRTEYPDLLNETVICEYLKQVAPIDYRAEFKSNLIHSSISEEYIDLNNKIGTYQISLNDFSDIRKNYGLVVEGTGDEVQSLHYFKLGDEEDEFGVLAWGWYAITAFTKAIPDSDKNQGIRLRSHNIMIGDSKLLNPYFPETRGNKYFVGEIHTLSPKLKPDSSRSGLTPTPESEQLKTLFKDYFQHLHNIYYLANQTKNAIKEIDEQKGRLEQTQNTDDLPEVQVKVEESQKKLERIEKAPKAQAEDARKVLDAIKKKLDKLPDPQPTTPNPMPVPQPKPKENPFEKLEAEYTKQEVNMFNKIFSIMEKKCFAQDAKLIESMKKLVIKELIKK